MGTTKDQPYAQNGCYRCETRMMNKHNTSQSVSDGYSNLPMLLHACTYDVRTADGVRFLCAIELNKKEKKIHWTTRTNRMDWSQVCVSVCKRACDYIGFNINIATTTTAASGKNVMFLRCDTVHRIQQLVTPLHGGQSGPDTHNQTGIEFK